MENFPGTITISGTELADSMMSQILEQGADIEFETVTGITDNGETKTVCTEEGSSFECISVIIATGVKHRLLGLEGEKELIGEGISFCAVCDGDFYTGKSVIMAGGGNSALQEAILLSDKCKSVTILQDLPYFTGEESLQKLLLSRDNVTAHTGVKIAKLLIDNGEFTGVEITDENGETKPIYADGLFVAIGLIPENEPFANLAALNSYG